MFLGITVIIGVLLLAAGILDMKRRSVSRGFLALLLLVCVVGIFVRKDFGIWDAAGGALIGLCAIGLSMVSKEEIGRGDGFVIGAIGLVLGFWECLAAVCLASVLMAFVSIVILILKKGNKKTRVPFIPAIFAGYVMCITTIV